MQSNDLNKLLSSYEGLSFTQIMKDECPSNNIQISELSPCRKRYSKEELKDAKKPISKELLVQVQSDVKKYELFGKSRRWIRRYIKRKYNITEY